jgi:arsenate reductase
MTDKSVDVTIYHNPSCGTSRNTLGLILNAGVRPHIVDYLRDVPNRSQIVDLIQRAGLTVREAIRQKDTPYHDLGMDDPEWTDDKLLDAIQRFPILLNRPFVVTPWGVKLCRPSEAVLDILPLPQRASFAKEDGELVIDADGGRIETKNS